MWFPENGAVAAPECTWRLADFGRIVKQNAF